MDIGAHEKASSSLYLGLADCSSAIRSVFDLRPQTATGAVQELFRPLPPVVTVVNQSQSPLRTRIAPYMASGEVMAERVTRNHDRRHIHRSP